MISEKELQEKFIPYIDGKAIRYLKNAQKGESYFNFLNYIKNVVSIDHSSQSIEIKNCIQQISDLYFECISLFEKIIIEANKNHAEIIDSLGLQLSAYDYFDQLESMVLFLNDRFFAVRFSLIESNPDKSENVLQECIKRKDSLYNFIYDCGLLIVDESKEIASDRLKIYRKLQELKNS